LQQAAALRPGKKFAVDQSETGDLEWARLVLVGALQRLAGKGLNPHLEVRYSFTRSCRRTLPGPLGAAIENLAAFTGHDRVIAVRCDDRRDDLAGCFC
jgi:hypothetical protein